MNKAKSGFKNLLPILFILLIGGIGVQTFTSCSSDESDEEQPSNGGGSSSSTGDGGGGASSSGGSGGGSSNSSGGGNHFNPNITYGSLIDSRDGKTYKTVSIGDQTWMAENLNYEAEGSMCYNNDPANCAKYGRLYDWVMAMILDPGCKSNSCSNQIQSPHKGICPSGWHLSSAAEWTTLMNYVGGIRYVDGFREAGAKLKATSGWNNGGNGTDDYGFSALPGGSYEVNSFKDVGNRGRWLCATEGTGGIVFNYAMNYNRNDVLYVGLGGKSDMSSLRCLKDDGNGQGGGSSSSGNPSGAWCVDHNLGECTNNPFVIESQESCENWLGVFEDSCPADYTKYDYNNPSGMWCVDYDYGACTDDPYYTSSDENCALWDGVLENSCPL